MNGRRSGAAGSDTAFAATRVIDIRTEIPGPRRREILERERNAVAHPLIVHEPIVAERARGSTITDVDGNTFVDFVGGVGVANVGHNHPRVVEAITEQAERFLHAYEIAKAPPACTAALMRRHRWISPGRMVITGLS